MRTGSDMQEQNLFWAAGHKGGPRVQVLMGTAAWTGPLEPLGGDQGPSHWEEPHTREGSRWGSLWGP